MMRSCWRTTIASYTISSSIGFALRARISKELLMSLWFYRRQVTNTKQEGKCWSARLVIFFIVDHKTIRNSIGLQISLRCQYWARQEQPSRHCDRSISQPGTLKTVITFTTLSKIKSTLPTSLLTNSTDLSHWAKQFPKSGLVLIQNEGYPKS